MCTTGRYLQRTDAELSVAATGGKSQFNERLKVLYGRDVVAFPDVDSYSTWCEKVKDFPGLNISVSNLLQSNATLEDMENHIDIANWLIR